MEVDDCSSYLLSDFHSMFIFLAAWKAFKVCPAHITLAGHWHTHNTGLILGLRPANERLCYFVTTFLIGWAQA